MKMIDLFATVGWVTVVTLAIGALLVLLLPLLTDGTLTYRSDAEMRVERDLKDDA